MAFDGPVNKKLNGGLGRRNPSADNVGGLVMGGVAVADKIALGDIKKLIQLQDAVALGLTPAYDNANNVQVYYHIAEFFRINPNGTLFIMLVAKTVTQTQMVDVELDHLKKLITTEKSIRVVGIVRNPADAYAPLSTNGIDDDCEAAIPKAQALVNHFFDNKIYVDAIILEGRNVAGTIGDLLDVRTLAASAISVCIAQDPAQVALNDEYEKSAAVGNALGSVLVRKVSENLGSVNIANKPDARRGEPSFSLTDMATGRFVTAAISSGANVATLSPTEQNLLTAKGYLFVGFFEGFEGMYWNDGSTCVELASDYAYIENNRVWNKAARLVRNALIPRIRGEVDVNPANGQLSATTIAAWREDAKRALTQMIIDDEISNEIIDERAFFIDPAQNVLAGDPIVVRVSVIPKGIARAITNEIGFENPFNQ